MEGGFGAELYLFRARVDVRADVSGLKRCSAQCSCNSVMEGGGVMFTDQASIHLQVISRSPGSSSAQSPLAAVEKEEEEGKDCCLATGGSRVIS